MQHPILLLLLLGLSLAQMEMEETREGRPTKDTDIKCGKWTNVIATVFPDTKGVTMETTKGTRRCTVLFKPGADEGYQCTELELTCSKFFVDNRDPWKCKRGDQFWTKSGDTKPRVWCKRDGPTKNYPVLAPDETNIKAWYINKMYINDMRRYPKKGIKCTVKCIQTKPSG